MLIQKRIHLRYVGSRSFSAGVFFSHMRSANPFLPQIARKMHIATILLLSLLSTLTAARCCVMKATYVNCYDSQTCREAFSFVCEEFFGSRSGMVDFRGIDAQQQYRGVCLGVTSSVQRRGWDYFANFGPNGVPIWWSCQHDDKPGDTCGV